MEPNGLFTSEIVRKVELVKKLLEEDSSIDGTVGEYLILSFLYAYECDVEKAQEKIIKFCKYRKQYPRVIKSADFFEDNFQYIYRQRVFTTDINQEHLKFPLIGVLNTSCTDDIDIYDIVHVSRIAFITGILHSQRVRQHGAIFIFNLTALPFSLLLQVTPTLLVQSLNTLVCVGGDLLKKIIMVNTGMIVGTTIRAVRLLLPNHINDILEVHNGSWDCLENEIPRESLPIDYGGTNGTIEECNDHLLPIMIKWRDVILNHF
ncbi:hypothetical protein CHUAL_002842 [Chamberlinius hualienensis]